MEQFFDIHSLKSLVETTENISELSKIPQIQYRYKIKQELEDNGVEAEHAEKISLLLEIDFSNDKSPEAVEQAEHVIYWTSKAIANFYKAYALYFKDRDMILQHVLKDSFVKITL